MTSTAPSPRKRSKKAAKASALRDFGDSLSSDQWEAFARDFVAATPDGRSAAKFLGHDGGGGALYLWGIATALQGSVSPLQQTLAQLAVGDASSVAGLSQSDRDALLDGSHRLSERDYRDEMSVVDAAETVMWAAAFPLLSAVLPQEQWRRCGERLVKIHADAGLRGDATSPLFLLLAGELGMTLAWRLAVMPSCAKLATSSVKAVIAYIEGEGESIDRALVRSADLRLVVASLVRCERLLPLVSKKKFSQRNRDIAAEFATWMAAMSRCDGTQVLTAVNAEECAVDYQKEVKRDGTAGDDSSKPTHETTSVPEPQGKRKGNGPELHGLMLAASKFDTETLPPSMAAALGQSHTGGRLAWEVSLPEAMWHSETGQTFAMLPEWDVKRGRTFVDYSGEDIRVEVMAGRRPLFEGVHQTMVRVDGVDLQPTSDWECTCEYTDDDVHLVELEQRFGDYVLQRQWMLIRDDRCLMVSDAVLPYENGATVEADAKATRTSGRPAVAPEIQCVSRLPLAAGVEVVEDEEVRELVLLNRSKRRAMVMPLAANEWRVGQTDCQTAVSDDRHLVVTTTGQGAVYSPVWIDMETGRLRRKRTWRQLTIAEDLTIIPRGIAAAFRVQMGSEHWVVYRSLAPGGPRSLMGKHLIADFFAARFHPGDGGMEELVTVDASSDAE
ncbi:hypothetical protein [Rhodopirellula sallentina]|uniref:hypothetical protein n=1 Tax=Rhodopirellula sallentina TaxID=1263869 RepID=UPI0003457077|nr:hypothetical protein [Rhodopirellula sallentina]